MGMKVVILRVERNGGWEWVSGKTGIALAEAFIFFLPPPKLEMSMELWTWSMLTEKGDREWGNTCF